VKRQKILVTPKLAAEWLKLNPATNRNMKPTAIARYAADMRAGNWPITGNNAILFSGDFEILADGQNRLTAVIEAGCDVAMEIVTGLPSEVFPNIDQGVTRGFDDVLKITGRDETNCKIVAAALKMYWRYKETGTPYYPGEVPSVAQLLELRSSAQGTRLVKSVNIALQHRTPLVAPTAMGFAHCIFAKNNRSDEPKATDFIELLASGAVGDSAHPVLLLRKRLIDNRTSLTAKLTTSSVLWLVFRTWNAFKTGESPQKLQLPKPSLGANGKPQSPVLPQVL